MARSSSSPSVSSSCARRALVYERLVLRISAAQGAAGGLETTVVRSPVGEPGSARFEMPVDAAGLALLDADLDAGAWRHVRSVREGKVEDLLEIGRRLGRSLFNGPVAEALQGAIASVRVRDGTGLRIDLRIDRELPEAPMLHALPWELVVRPNDSRPLCLDRRTPLVRYLEGPRDPRPPGRPERLRILVVAPRPAGLPSLDVEREIADVRTPWPGRVEVEVLESPTLASLRQTLVNGRFHGLHFVGHGRFDGARGVGELLFEDGEGGADAVSAESLVGQVGDIAEHLRIVVVNACESARPGRRDPALGIAHTLAGTGVPAVVAMRSLVSDRAALAFARSLYERLAEGDPVEAAVAEGRRAIAREIRDRPEVAATPVLFSRAEDGRLFREVTDEPERDEVEGTPPPRRRAPALILALVVFLGLLALSLGWMSWDRGGWVGKEADGDGAPPGVDGFQGLLDPGSSLEDERGRESESVDEPAEGGRGAELPVESADPSESIESSGSKGPDVPAPRPRTVPDGQSVRLPEVAATVRIDFIEVEGESLVKVATIPDGGKVITRVVAGPTTLEVEGGGLPFRLHVLGVDWNRRTVELQSGPSG